MTPWACHALGEEARRLRYCLRTCAPSKPPSASMLAVCEMYIGTALNAEGWEQSIDKKSMRVAGLSPLVSLKQLRSDVSYYRAQYPQNSSRGDLIIPILNALLPSYTSDYTHSLEGERRLRGRSHCLSQ